ncbi:hypothetical protein RN001_002922 [Aquatica leii]|uniref:UBR-type domain-containing protein n=1 Tax=Aquatica leii TaxID=1421715 RepID=A0AAN7SDL4_9COLE|nr:hypothetical protein RN001_002922 [Aquatica leii]
MSEETESIDQSIEDNEQGVVTLGEVLQDEQQMIDDANAVLGAIDDKKCTYSEGYMKRQALYSCLTCIPDARHDALKAAGICLGCCYHCHEGHELVELYTKRNFRCDCGNSKFNNAPCKLENSKSDINEFNHYNQNFCGKYCSCNRPYPDPEDSVEDEMIQCIICEDWFHVRHLNIQLPPNTPYCEMSCETCVQKHPFLLHYTSLCANDGKGIENDEMLTQSETADDGQDVLMVESSDNNIEKCIKPKMKSNSTSSKFWADIDWRKKLCTCPECIKIYEEENVMFLLDPQDTVQVYEEKGKEKAREFEEKQQENGMKYLNSLNRVPLMEAIAGYNNLKENLIEYLKKFAENKKVVREEDIKEFFSNFDTKKKQKSEVSHYCS